MAFNVVIAGGGFGGVSAANQLARRLPRHSARITLVNDTNFLLYTPPRRARWSPGTSSCRCARRSSRAWS
jgi:NADH dehydrogenase FAD-containing subunit